MQRTSKRRLENPKTSGMRELKYINSGDGTTIYPSLRLQRSSDGHEAQGLQYGQIELGGDTTAAWAIGVW